MRQKQKISQLEKKGSTPVDPIVYLDTTCSGSHSEDLGTVQIWAAAYKDVLYLSMGNAASLLGMSRKSFSRHVVAGRITFFIKGSGTKRPRRCFSQQHLRQFVQENSFLQRSDDVNR